MESPVGSRKTWLQLWEKQAPEAKEAATGKHCDDKACSQGTRQPKGHAKHVAVMEVQTTRAEWFSSSYSSVQLRV